MSDPAPPAPTPPPSPPEPETFSKDYVRELRGENKGYRLKLTETEQRLADALTKQTAAEAAAAEKITAAETAAQSRIIRAEMKAHALAAGMVDLDGLKLLDLAAVKMNDAGEIEGAAEIIAAAKEAKPWLFGAAPRTTGSTAPTPTPTPPAAKNAKDMTPEEYAASKRAFLGR